MAIHSLVRANSSKKTVGDALSDTFANTGENLGTFDLSIKKVGNAYTLTCGDKSPLRNVRRNYTHIVGHT